MNKAIQISILALFTVLGFVAAYNPNAGMTLAQVRQLVSDTASNMQYSRLLNSPVNISTFTNNVPYLTTAPVTSVNGQTGAVSLPLGSVTSVGATSTDLDVSNSPITSSGNIIVNIKSANKNKWDTAYNYRELVYNSSGRINTQMKRWVGIISPSTASGHTVDISSAGFTTIYGIQVSAANNTGSATSVPLVGIKSYSTTSIVINIVSSNNSTIGSLLSPIIGLIFPSSVSGYTIHVMVLGV